MSSCILTVAFALVLLAGSAIAKTGFTMRVILTSTIMGLAVLVSAIVWGSGPTDKDDHGGQ
jgi:hypothetical protein